jgi:hypothetical protein
MNTMRPLRALPLLPRPAAKRGPWSHPAAATLLATAGPASTAVPVTLTKQETPKPELRSEPTHTGGAPSSRRAGPPRAAGLPPAVPQSREACGCGGEPGNRRRRTGTPRHVDPHA